ncbi:hypothetical protein V1514DRAFT_324444 [Lipomyces japonicus]|uniref:uncharacterized protein n=1 Tax=Lipomyces japonicus TaxID=56871 RepID=UPI0034CFD31D
MSTRDHYSDNRSYRNRHNYHDRDRGRDRSRRSSPPRRWERNDDRSKRSRYDSDYSSDDNNWKLGTSSNRQKRYRSRSRSRSRSPSPEYGRPSKDVILQGLADETTEEELQECLSDCGAKFNSVVIIRERGTKKSQGYGFARFGNLKLAQEFIDQNYPTIKCNTSSNIRIAFSRDHNDTGLEGGWTCSSCDAVNYPRRVICFKCTAQKPEVADKVKNGDGDASENPSQFLLLRGLDIDLTETDIAEKIKELDQPFRRVILIRDRVGKSSWGFAFVEYASTAACSNVLKNLTEHGLEIHGKSLTPSFIHPGVFMPVYMPLDDDESYAFLAANGSTKLKYWDETGYASVHINESFKEPVREGDGSIKKSQDKVVATADKPKKKKIEPVVTTRRMAPQLQKWQDRQAELHGSSAIDAEQEDLSALARSSSLQESFSDPRKPACLLCMRKFAAFDEVNKHERLSKLHDYHLRNSESVSKGKIRMTKAKANAQGYRDRARERRVANNQPARRAARNNNEQSGSSSKPILPVTGKEKEESDEEDDMFAVNNNSKASKMMEKMGWSSGSGLGVNQTGIVEAIRPKVFSAGVGLGAEQGKDAATEGKPTTTYNSFVEKVRDSARERFEQSQ